MTTDASSRRQLRIRDVLVLATIVLIGAGSFLYQWVKSYVQVVPESEAESRAQMRDEFLKANAEPAFRMVNIPNISLQVVFFNSGPQDTIRAGDIGHVCSIVDVEKETGYFVCLPERNGLADHDLVNIRFCQHLTVMGNSKRKEIERKLLELPPFPKLSELALPLSAEQADGPYAFRDLKLTQIGDRWQLSGSVNYSGSICRLSTVFHYELYGGERVWRGRLQLPSLPAGMPVPFVIDLPKDIAPQMQMPDSLRLKIVLEFASNRKFRN